MCGLCGTLGNGKHWTDGLTPSGAAPAASAEPALRRRTRRQLTAQGNRLLRHYGLTMEDWQGTSYVLRSRTGGGRMAGGLADLWPNAERLCGRLIDPLDAGLLDALDADRARR